MTYSYVPLQVFSAFSLQDSIIEVGQLVQKSFDHGFPACALTDRSNIFALVSFYKKALKKGLKPLIGSHVTFKVQGKKLQASLYCKNVQGYRKLSAALSQLFKDRPFTNQINLKQLQAHGELLIILQQDDLVNYASKTSEILTELENSFDRHDIFFGLERYENHQRSFFDSQKVITLGEQHRISCVTANKVFFLQKEDYQSQQIKYCIQKGLYMDDQHRPIKHFEYQYLYSSEQMSQLFESCPQALKNTLVIAQKCSLEIDFKSIFLPAFSDDENLTLKEMALQGLEERAEKKQLYLSDRQEYQKRLDRELDVIKTMGFAGYFLIVADFIQWAKKENIPVGPGRGSGAGSLVAYALKITDLDPLRYNLLFERFLNPERVSMPDFDIDFCMDKRDLVIHYVQNRYGHNNVSQIATFGTMAAKAVVRDVGRVLHHPYGFVDKVAKLIPLDLGMTLNQALEQSSGLKSLYHEDEVVKELIDLALKLEGLPRNIGKHAGGVIIAPKSLDYFCPLYNEPNTDWHPVSGLDKDDIETLGLVKFDFLGLRTLTILDWTYQNLTIEEKENIPTLENLPLDCQDSYQQLQKAHTTAVFQLESRGMKQLILKLQPDCFEDMVALVALFRPGPLQSGMVDDFIDRKHGRSPIVYLHPDLEEILKPTYGVILYQEQVMQIAQVLAGYSLGQADLLRRAMGKKKPEEMAKQRVIFLEGCLKNSIDESIAGEIFDIMEKFAGYGFNKSHSAAYALIAYQTLYLKTHVKEAFFAANMSADHGNLDKIKNLILDAKTDNIEVLPPCINRSQLHFKPYGSQKITYGLKAVKGLGEQVLEVILQEREEHGKYESFDDFMKRTSSFKIQRRTLEIMAHAGLFDVFDLNRRAFVEDKIEKKIHQYYKTCQKQGLLFEFEDQDIPSPIISDYLWSHKLKKEQSLLGLSFSGDLLDPYKAIKQSLFKPLKSFTQGHSDRGYYCVFAYSARELTTAAGKRLAILGFYDGQYSVDILVDKEKNLDLLENYQKRQSLAAPLIVFLERTTGRQKKKYTQMKSLVSLEDFLLEKARSIFLRTQDIEMLDQPLKLFLQEIQQQDLSLQVSMELIDPQTKLSQIYSLQKETDFQREDSEDDLAKFDQLEESDAKEDGYSQILTFIEKAFAFEALSLEIN